jgi:hypothetical protein
MLRVRTIEISSVKFPKPTTDRAVLRRVHDPLLLRWGWEYLTPRRWVYLVRWR